MRLGIGRDIESLKLEDNMLVFGFKDHQSLFVWDDDRDCCEGRWMSTDDSLSAFIGATFLGMRLGEAKEVPAEHCVKEVQFLIIFTSLGEFTVANYNEHNGYYGGFDIGVERRWAK